MRLHLSLAVAALALAACADDTANTAPVQAAPVVAAPAAPAAPVNGRYRGHANLRAGEQANCTPATSTVTLRVNKNVASVKVGAGRAASGAINAERAIRITANGYRLDGKFDGRSFSGTAVRGSCTWAVSATAS